MSSHIGLIENHFDISALDQQLREHPEVWNKIDRRTVFPSSPHREVDDVWVRYNDYKNWGPRFNDPHVSVWYPVVEILPAAKLLAIELASCLAADRIGGVIITRIPARKRVYPHVDEGWHARFYEKYVIQVKGNLDQSFCFEDGSLSVQTGQCYWFDNAFSHWVTNQSDEDRISLIICIRRERCH